MSNRTGLVQIIVVVSNDSARDFKLKGAWEGTDKDIDGLVKDFGLAIQPLHPGTKDAQLSRYFVVDRIDPTVAHRLASRLRSSPAVESVYVKVPGEAP